MSNRLYMSGCDTAVDSTASDSIAHHKTPTETKSFELIAMQYTPCTAFSNRTQLSKNEHVLRISLATSHIFDLMCQSKFPLAFNYSVSKVGKWPQVDKRFRDPRWLKMVVLLPLAPLDIFVIWPRLQARVSTKIANTVWVWCTILTYTMPIRLI